MAAALRVGDSDALDDHRLVDGFAHVDDGEGGDGDGGQGFHFDAGLGVGCGGGGEVDAVVFERGLHVDLVEGERVAEGDELVGALGGGDAGETGGLEEVALLKRVVADGG